MDAEALGRFIDERYNRRGDRLFQMEIRSSRCGHVGSSPTSGAQDSHGLG